MSNLYKKIILSMRANDRERDTIIGMAIQYWENQVLKQY
jgi:hypothetical protein